MATVLFISSILLGWTGEPPQPSSPRPGVSDEIVLDLNRLESLHRSILRGPIETWKLEPVRSGYEAVLKTSTNPEAERLVRDRLDRVSRQMDVASSARKLKSLLDRSHRRDANVAQVTGAIEKLDRASKSRFAAVGQIQVSSKFIEGHRVFALIGKKGYAIAYLDIPPGFDAKGLTSKRVGVRGQSRFSEELGTKLIAVRDMEALE